MKNIIIGAVVIPLIFAVLAFIDIGMRRFMEYTGFINKTYATDGLITIVCLFVFVVILYGIGAVVTGEK